MFDNLSASDMPSPDAIMNDLVLLLKCTEADIHAIMAALSTTSFGPPQRSECTSVVGHLVTALETACNTSRHIPRISTVVNHPSEVLRIFADEYGHNNGAQT